MTNQQAARILTRINNELRERPDNLKAISDAIDTGIKALRDLEEAKELLMEITDYNNPGFLIPKIEKFIAKLE